MVQASPYTSSGAVTPNCSPFGCFYTTNPSPFPGSNLWSLSFSTFSLHQWTRVSGWGVQGRGADHLFRFLYMLAATNQFLCSSKALKLPLCPGLIPISEGTSWGGVPFQFLSFFFVLPSYMESFLPFPEFGCLLPVFSRIFSEDQSICWWLDKFVGGGELHVYYSVILIQKSTFKYIRHSHNFKGCILKLFPEGIQKIKCDTYSLEKVST